MLLKLQYAIKYYLIVFASILAIFIILTKLDPFGLGTATMRQSTDLYYKIKAASYPGAGQDKISVVLLRDSDLKSNYVTWPVPYDFHALVLERIADRKPKAIMIDLLFVDDRSEANNSLEDLTSLFQKSNSQPKNGEETSEPRIFLAALTADREHSDVIERLKNTTYSAVVRWPIKTQAEMSPLYYPLARGAGVSGDAPSAAYRIFQYLCSGENADCKIPWPGSSQFQEPMKIFWGVEPTKRPFRKVDCTPVEADPYDRWKQWLNTPRMDFLQKCPYSPQLSIADLLDSSTENEAKVRWMIKDRVVFYGSTLVGSGDVTQSPVHGRVPGILLHAMALDNLLALGPNYHRTLGTNSDKSPLDEIFLGFGQRSFIIVTISFLLSMMIAISIKEVVFEIFEFLSESMLAHLAISVLFEISFAAVIFWLVFYHYEKFDLSSFDWIGLVVMAGIPITFSELYAWKREFKQRYDTLI